MLTKTADFVRNIYPPAGDGDPARGSDGDTGHQNFFQTFKRDSPQIELDDENTAVYSRSAAQFFPGSSLSQSSSPSQRGSSPQKQPPPSLNQAAQRSERELPQKQPLYSLN